MTEWSYTEILFYTFGLFLTGVCVGILWGRATYDKMLSFMTDEEVIALRNALREQRIANSASGDDLPN